jgi:hypothetical protein
MGKEKCMQEFGHSTSRKYRHRWDDNIKVYLKETMSLRIRIGLCWLRIRSSGGCCEGGRDPSSSANGGEFIDRPSSHQVLKEDPTS